jgi:hypothetical protein
MTTLDTLTEFHKSGLKCARSIINPFENIITKSNPNATDVAMAYLAMIGYVMTSALSPIPYLYGGFSSLRNKSPSEETH